MSLSRRSRPQLHLLLLHLLLLHLLLMHLLLMHLLLRLRWLHLHHPCLPPAFPSPQQHHLYHHLPLQLLLQSVLRPLSSRLVHLPLNHSPLPLYHHHHHHHPSRLAL